MIKFINNLKINLVTLFMFVNEEVGKTKKMDEYKPVARSKKPAHAEDP